MDASYQNASGFRLGLSRCLEDVGSRVELMRLLDDLRFAKTGSLNRLRSLQVEVQATPQLAELIRARQHVIGSVPAASAASVLLSSASGNANDVKTKIDDVLLLYERYKGAGEMVDQVILLRDALQGCYLAIERKDWERAAFLANRAREVPESILTSEFAERMVPSAEHPGKPIDALRTACDDLAKIFLREFNSATKTKQMDKVSLYFKLFPLIGHHEEGLNAYATFLCQTVTGMARSILHSSNQQAKQNAIFYGAVLTKLFENLAEIIEQHGQIINRHYGRGEMLSSVIKVVQKEVDRQVGLIIDTFWDERRVENLIIRVKSYDYPVLTSILTQNGNKNLSSSSTINANRTVMAEDEEISDLKEASARLSEIEAMLNHWSLYVLFLLQREDADESLQVALEQSKTAEKVGDLLGPTFSVLVLFVFRRSVERASKMDELPTKNQINAQPKFSSENPLVSSMVDDILFVFNQVLVQIVETGHTQTIENSIASIRRVLESDLIGILRRKLQASAPTDISSNSEFGGAGSFMIYLNNLEMCTQYISEAVGRCQGRLSEQLRPQLELIRSSFQKLASELLLDGCQNLAAKRIASQVRNLVSTHFKTTAYSSNESMRCGNAFVLGWHQIIRPLQRIMHPNVLTMLMDIVCRHLSQSLEKFVWSLQSKLTITGCLDIDKDLNQVITVVGEIHYSLRQRFTKVSQIVSGLIDDTNDLSALSAEEKKRLEQVRLSIRHV